MDNIDGQQTVSATDAGVVGQNEVIVNEAENKVEVEAAKTEVEVEKKQEEAKKEDDKEEKKDSDRFAAKFAALSRKEKQIREREKELKLQADKIKKMEQELEANKTGSAKKDEQKQPIETVEQFKRRLLKEGIKALEKEGLTYEMLTKQVLNDGKFDPETQIKVLREEIREEIQNEFEQKYGKKFEEYDKKLKEKEEQEYKAREEYAVSEFKSNIGEFIKENSSNLQLLAQEDDAAETVYGFIDDYYRSTTEYDDEGNLVKEGKVLSIEEATQAIEADMLEQLKKYMKTDKIKSIITGGQPAATQASTPKEPENKDKKQSITLSNTLSQKSPSTDNVNLSEEERLKRAAALIKFN